MEIGKNVKDIVVTLAGLGVGCYLAYLGYVSEASFCIGGALTYGIKNGYHAIKDKSEESIKVKRIE